MYDFKAFGELLGSDLKYKRLRDVRGHTRGLLVYRQCGRAVGTNPLAGVGISGALIAAAVFLELLRKIDKVAARVGELRLAEQDRGARDAEALTPRVYENPRQVVFAVGERRGGTALAV